MRPRTKQRARAARPDGTLLILLEALNGQHAAGPLLRPRNLDAEVGDPRDEEVAVAVSAGNRAEVHTRRLWDKPGTGSARTVTALSRVSAELCDVRIDSLAHSPLRLILPGAPRAHYDQQSYKEAERQGAHR
jgi:hypothetical protein